MTVRSGVRLLWVLTAVLGVVAATAWAQAPKDGPRKHRIVYQLNDPGVDKAKFVLGNMRNHVKGVGGWENIEAMELVVFGPGLKSFVAKGMDPDLRRTLEALQSEGLAFGACGNTMKNFKITLGELPAGAKPLPQGGVVRIMELQERGYAYIRP